VTRLEQFPNLLVIVKSMSLGDPPQNHFNSIDPRRTWGRWRANSSTSILNNSVLPQGRRLGVLAQSNPSKSGGVRLEAAFKPRGADHVYTPEASDPL
jgi:hypothetical protein